jgi:hypothetical protein
LDRYVRAGFMVLMGLVLFPFLKTFFDTFTNPTTGAMLFDPVTGLPRTWFTDDAVAIAGFIPWAVPIITLIVAVYIIIKPEQPPEDRPPNV